MLSITTCAPSIGSAPTWTVVTAGSGIFLSEKSSATMVATRRMSPVPATNARSFTKVAPPLARSSALSASCTCWVSRPFADRGET